MPSRTCLTKRQSDTISQVENYLGISLVQGAEYVKNVVISLETRSLNQQQLNAIEGYGRHFGAYRVEPCGYRKVCLILIKSAQAGEGEAKP